MRVPTWVALAIELVILVYAAYDIFAPTGAWRPFQLPEGMNVALASVAIAMTAIVLTTHVETAARAADLKNSGRIAEALAQRGSLCTTVHEKEFYSMWPAHFAAAQRNVDITHLGGGMPNKRQSRTEDAYYAMLAKLVKGSSADIRRVERVTDAKLPWIQRLITDLGKSPKFSLALYEEDVQDGEMPLALSVSRVDSKYGWIISLAEERSTRGSRDLLVCDPDAVNMLAAYFTERVWKRSTLVVNKGRLLEGVWNEIQAKYKA